MSDVLFWLKQELLENYHNILEECKSISKFLHYFEGKEQRSEKNTNTKQMY